MAPRLYVGPQALQPGVLALPEGPTRHVQVRRLQPGDALLLFDGRGAEWPSRVLAMGRTVVEVEVGLPQAVDRELPWSTGLAVGMPANERMDGLVEKLAELGLGTLQPLVCERSVLRLQGERALRRQSHWQAVAVAACEQCGRTRVPQIRVPMTLQAWLDGSTGATLGQDAGRHSGQGDARWLLSPAAALGPPVRPVMGASVWALSGPEGGLSDDEQALARSRGFVDVGLGPRVLRADTAPLALLAWLGIGAGP